MTILAPDKLSTPDDLLRLEGNGQFELIDGQLVEKPTGALASLVAATIIGILGQYVHARRLGRVFATDCGYQIFTAEPGKVRYPDGTFIRREKLAAGAVPAGHLRVIPDLAVEVVSPNDEWLNVEQRIEDYLQAGVPLVWVVTPETRRVMIFRANGTVARLTPEAEITGEDVIPEFKCRVEEFFADI